MTSEEAIEIIRAMGPLPDERIHEVQTRLIACQISNGETLFRFRQIADMRYRSGTGLPLLLATGELARLGHLKPGTAQDQQIKELPKQWRKSTPGSAAALAVALALKDLLMAHEDAKFVVAARDLERWWNGLQEPQLELSGFRQVWPSDHDLLLCHEIVYVDGKAQYYGMKFDTVLFAELPGDALFGVAWQLSHGFGRFEARISVYHEHFGPVDHRTTDVNLTGADPSHTWNIQAPLALKWTGRHYVEGSLNGKRMVRRQIEVKLR